MYNNESLPSRNFSYGAYEPIASDEVDRFWSQSRLAHRYRNKLVELELRRRAAYDEARRRHCADYVECENRWLSLNEQLQTLRDEISIQNKATRSRSASDEQRQRSRDLKRRQGEAYAELKIARERAKTNEALQAEQKALTESHQEALRRARAESGLYWCNYLVVEHACKEFAKGPPPRFKSWRGDGSIAVQIQNGISVQEALSGQDSRLRVVEMDADSDECPIKRPPHSKKRQTRPIYLVSIRAGSKDNQGRMCSGGRHPVWVRAPVVMHRPIPDGKIKWVKLFSRRVGTHHHWQVQFTVSRAEGFPIKDAAESGTVGVDIGWRLLSDRSLRVAYWRGDDGQEGQLVIPPRDVTRWLRSHTLRSTRDDMMNVIRVRFADWLDENQQILPDWLRNWRPDAHGNSSLSSLRQWRSAARLAALVVHWRDKRFAGDDAIFREIESWRKQDKHLLEWQSHQLTKAIRWRDHTYRVFTARLRRRYRKVCVENINWREMGELPEVEENEPLIEGPRYYRHVAAPGRLSEIIVQGFAEHEFVDPFGTTLVCQSCAHECEVNRWLLSHRCENCFQEWDIDQNASVNILNRGAPASGAVLS